MQQRRLRMTLHCWPLPEPGTSGQRTLVHRPIPTTPFQQRPPSLEEAAVRAYLPTCGPRLLLAAHSAGGAAAAGQQGAPAPRRCTQAAPGPPGRGRPPPRSRPGLRTPARVCLQMSCPCKPRTGGSVLVK